MTKIFQKTSLFSAMLAISACSGSSDPDTTTAPDIPTSNNGLAFATDTSEVSDLLGQTANVRIARFITDEVTGETSVEISDETFRVDAVGADDYTLTLNGDTITFSGGEGTRDGGVQIFTRPTTEGDFARVIPVFSYVYRNPGFSTGENTEAFLITGFETNPNDVDALTGSLTYTGQLNGAGTLITDDGATIQNEVRLRGETTIVADFGGNTVSGDSSIQISDSFTNDVLFTFDMELDDTISIDGNSFSGALALTDCATGFTCTSTDSQIEGVFYGPDADELGALAAIDVTGTDGGGDETRFVGSGGFLAPGVE